VAVLSLLLATSLVPGFRLDTSVSGWQLAVLRLPIYFALALIILRPVLIILTLPLNSLTLGAPSLLVNGLILYLTAKVEPAFVIANYGEALIGTVVMTALATGVVGWLGLDEAYPFYQSIIYRIGRRFGPRPERKPLRGLLILQIDGLSYRSLQRVLATGRMPTISAMLAKGTHRLLHWDCGIPSNTPAVQAGLFYGDRQNVAGYRWFDRREQKLRVVSNPEDLRLIEEAAARRGPGLLAGGSCINSFLSGGAAKRLLTVSALGEQNQDKREGEQADFNLFFLSPFAYTMAVVGAVWDYAAGVVLALAGRLRKDRPHLKFSIKRVAQKAVANSFLRDLSFFWLKQDMVRGVPVIYSNFVGYDEVAHHTDPDTYEAQIALSGFDRRLRRLRRRARRQSPIRYDIVVLSDHGQTPSVPFRILYGETIEQTLAAMLGRTLDQESDPRRAFNPDRSYTASLLAQMERAGPRGLGWAAQRGRRALANIMTEETSGAEAQQDGSKVVVCVSGSLAHVYFTGHDRPLYLEEILVQYPGLVEDLSRHPGIGFVASCREFGDAVAICDDGIRNLITGEMGGSNDPLAPYGRPDHWAGELAQLLGYPDSGDLIINGAWLPDSRRIVVLEEQTSSHGGLGGAQTEPFVLLPRGWSTSVADFESPESLHGLIRRELARYGHNLDGTGNSAARAGLPAESGDMA
jgi:uncharacterized membrane protein YvlD (DUF360 family)